MTIKAILSIIAAIVVAALILLYATALYQGKATMDPLLQTALIGMILAITSGVTIYVQTRQGQLSREHSDQNAALTQSHVAGTEQKMSTLIERVEDGLGTKMAGLVKDNAAEVAEALRVRNLEEQLTGLSAKLDSLLQMQGQATQTPPPPPMSSAPDRLIVAIEKNTAETASNTARPDTDVSIDEIMDRR